MFTRVTLKIVLEFGSSFISIRDHTMSVIFNEQDKSFTLTNGRIMYVMQLFHENYLGHLYFGKALRHFNTKRAFYQTEREGAPNPEPHADKRTFSLDVLPQEYGIYGSGDFRIPALEVTFANGTSTVDLRYKSHEIFKGKKPLENLPSSYVNDDKATTLELTMTEVAGELEVVLSFTIFDDVDVITRHARIKNVGKDTIYLRKAASMCLDLQGDEYDRISLYGKHAFERNVERTRLNHGIEIAASSRGATSHQHHNFLALAHKDTTEFNGDVWACTLVWSGNFEAATELCPYGSTRMVMGINGFDFKWQLKSGESFTTPEAVLVYSNEGLNGMSQQFHSFVRNNLARGVHQHKPRPVLVNSWEASYLNFTEDSIVNFAKDAVKLGAELIVLDDGWFGVRDKDNCSLGDWTEINAKKLPNGIKGLADRIHGLGAQFGLWVEPEMVSPNSNLFRKHPEWALGVPGHIRAQARNQYVLDLSRQDVRDYIVDSICEVLGSAEIDYVKWDMNRNLTDIGSLGFPPEQQHEIATRFQFGVYDIMNRITSAFPNILFESCAGGGRRFDMGIICYMPQTWTSDNTDEVCRQKIQYGTSFMFPPITMGSHVSACPNHQVGRSTPMLSRFICAMSGSFGYEMDLGKLSAEEQEEVKTHIALYKELRSTIQFGNFYRLMSPFEGTQNETAWQFVSKDGGEVILCYFRNLCQPQTNIRQLRLVGLEESATYKVTKHMFTKPIACNALDYLSNYNLEGDEFGGDELMSFGLNMDKVDADFAAYLVVLKRQ